MQLNDASILVTGGAGFVGSALVRDLLAKTTGTRITIVENFVNGQRAYVPEDDRVRVEEVDLTDAAALGDVVATARPDVVFHLAALHFIPYCNAHPAETLQVNVVGTQNLLDALKAAPPRQLVIASSAAVYPITEGANGEDDPAGPTDVYGLSKYVNEMQLAQYAAQTPTHCAAARLFNVYGPNETNPHVIPEILDQMLRGVGEIALGNVKPKRDYVYVDDVASALQAIARGNGHSCRIYNVGTGSEYSVEEIIDVLARVSGRPLRVAVAANRVRKADRMHLLCDPARLANELGWRARFTLESGLAALWQSVTAAAKARNVPSLVASA